MEQLSARTLHMKARSIRDKIGEDRLPQLVPGTVEMLMKWLMVVQCELCKHAIGINVTPADFGAPAEYQNDLESLGAKPDPYAKHGDMHGMIDHNAGHGARQAMWAGR